MKGRSSNGLNAGRGRRRFSRAALVALMGFVLVLAIMASASGAGVTLRVSTDSAGTQANGASLTSDISSSAQYVAFDSDASNLIAGDTNGSRDVFVKNAANGQVVRVTTSSAGAQQYGENPSISADGRYVAFQSAASGLIAGDTNGRVDVFVKDTQTGTTTRLGSWAQNPAISADGHYVAFEQVSSCSPGGWCSTYIAVANVSTGSTAVANAGYSLNPSISGDGRYVAFDMGGDVAVRDMQGGTVYADTIGLCEGYDACSQKQPSISANGRYVAWRFYSDDWTQVFIKDLSEGDITLVMEFSAEGLAFSAPDVSDDGQYVAFESREDPRAYGEVGVYVKDMLAGTTTRLSTDAAGANGNGRSMKPTISGDGSRASFMSDATNLSPGDTNGVSDIFMATSGSTCQPGKPVLGLASSGAYWGSYADYQARQLSVDYSISNAGPDAYGVQLVGAVNTMGATMASGIPGTLGDVATGGSLPAVVKYQVPGGVNSFKSSIYASASDACGVTYGYPGPLPGT